MADKLSASQIFSALLDGGFSREQARTMTAIAQAESARDPGAIGDVALQNRTFGPSVGLFQIRTVKAETGKGTDRDIEHLTGNIQAQVKAALHISNNGTNFRPWSTFTSGSFRKFLDTPLQAGVDLPAGSTGAVAAATGTATADPFAIDRGKSPIAVVDKDNDGLTDRFEELLGTDPNQADTDKDGLSDAFETATSHTDPLSKDTDKDDVPDDVEQAQHTDPGRADLPEAAVKAGFGGLDSLDSDKDGLSDGFEKRHGTDPLRADSDQDGLSDGDEFARGSDGASLDTNRDGLSDGFQAANNLDTLDDGPAGGLPGATPAGFTSAGPGSGGFGSGGLGSEGPGSADTAADGLGGADAADAVPDHDGY